MAQKESSQKRYGEGAVHRTAPADLLEEDRLRQVLSLLRVVSMPLSLSPPPATTVGRKDVGRGIIDGGSDRGSIASSEEA